jgi:hypothetical protein
MFPEITEQEVDTTIAKVLEWDRGVDKSVGAGRS